MPGRISQPKTASAYDGAFKSTNTTKNNNSGGRKRKQRERGLNAFAIAAAEHGKADQGRLRKHRFAREDEAAVEPLDSDLEQASDESGGHDGFEDQEREPRRKKQRLAAKNHKKEDEGDDDDDDSEIDSDEAFGDSDDERFEGFAFRGSSSSGATKHQKRARTQVKDSYEVDLDEDDAEEDDASEEDDSLGEDAVDLAQILDDNSEDDDFGGFDDEDEASRSEEEEDSLSEDDYEMEDENEEDEKERVQQLQRFVSSLPSASKDADQVAAQKAQPTAARMLAALKSMPAVDPAFANSLKKFSAANEAATSTSKTLRTAKTSLVQPPLPKRQQDRIDRAVAYDKAKEQLNYWLDTVKFNRRAEHLTFPLQDPSATEPLGTSKLLPPEQTKPRSALENAISTILEESGMGGSAKDEEKRIQDAETSQLKANNVPLEEIMARRTELRRARDLLFHEEKRAKRIKKIKSKAYRRVHRKEAERIAQKEKNLLAAAGILDEDEEEEKEKHDRRRAEARMGQRHKESKWAKNTKGAGRAKWDEDVQNGLLERARRSEDLRKRMDGKAARGSDEDDSAFSDDSDDEENDERLQKQLGMVASGTDAEENKSGSKLSSMKFMQRAEAARKKANDEAVEQLQRELAGNEEAENDRESSEEEEQERKIGRRIFGANVSRANASPEHEMRHPADRNELEECFISSDEENDISKSADKWDTEDVPTLDANSKLSSTKQVQERPKGELKFHGVAKAYSENSKSTSTATDLSRPEPKPVAPPSNMNTWNTVNLEKSLHASKSTENEEDDDAAGSEEEQPFVLPSNLELVQAAFGGEDEASAEFEAEKRAFEASEDEQVISTAMPGWGSWAGEGLSKRDKKYANAKLSDQRLQTKIPGVKPSSRKDSKLKRVIISEKPVKRNAKYLTPSLPHPFETKLQYERSLRIPIGPEWTTKETFQKSTRPRVIVRGGVIRPMEKPSV